MAQNSPSSQNLTEDTNGKDSRAQTRELKAKLEDMTLRAAPGTVSRQRPESIFPEIIFPGPGPNRLDHATSSSYRIGVGDELAIMYTFRPQPPTESQKILPHDVLTLSFFFAPTPQGESYRIQPMDELALYFRYSPTNGPMDSVSAQLSRIYTVHPDGTVSLIGTTQTIKVRDLSTSEIQALVEKAYRPLLQVPDVSVNVTPKFNLQRSLMDALGGSLLVETQIPDDGKITLPLIEEFDTRGKSIQALGAALTEKYRKLGFHSLAINATFHTIADERHSQLRELVKGNAYLTFEVNQTGRISLPLYESYEVVGKVPVQIAKELTQYYRSRGIDRAEIGIAIETPRSRVVRVLGAVQYPNVYAFHGNADLWGAIALAGGFTRDADMTRVRVVPAPGRPARGPFDFTQFMATGESEHDLIMNGDETIFVPRKSE